MGDGSENALLSAVLASLSRAGRNASFGFGSSRVSSAGSHIALYRAISFHASARWICSSAAIGSTTSPATSGTDIRLAKSAAIQFEHALINFRSFLVMVLSPVAPACSQNGLVAR